VLIYSTKEVNVTTKTYKVAGLSCTDCASRIEASVKGLDGVQDCDVDAQSGELTVYLDLAREGTPTPADEDVIAEIVENTGHELMDVSATVSAAEGGFLRFLLASRETTLTLVAAALTLVGLGLSAVGLSHELHRALSVLPFALAILVGGVPVARHAVQEVEVAHRLGINALMVIAVIGAMAIGEWAEAAIVVVLFAVGEALEGYAAERARGALTRLLELVPPRALRLRPDGTPEEVPVADLAVGDRVLVRPGDRVSVDGIVRAGESAVDQAAITGESIPVDKAPGDEVFAGTVNTYGALEVEVTRRAGNTTLSRMIELVREAQARRAPVQRFVDRFARVYTPLVAVTAVLVAVVPPLFFGQPFLTPAGQHSHGWLMRALQMLVIACPCALVISTPVSVVSALTRAASEGVLIKGGRTLEALGRVRVFAFDKTGTLTRGEPVTTDVLDVCPAPERHADPRSGLQYAAAVESQSSHPLARALVAEARAQKLTELPAQEVNVLSGHGITGVVDGSRVTVASHPYFDARVPHAEEVCEEAERLAAHGKTVMLVCHDDQVCSVFAVADTPRPESQEVLTALRDLGARTIMLTGDGQTVAEAIGARVGVDEVRAELLPEEKLAAIRELAEGDQAVAMVGDGVNDAPALAQATVGIAMGGAGTDQAMETADVVLMADDLRRLPDLVRLSRRTRRIIRANIAVALGVKAAVFVLAALGVATLWMAMVADVGASLAVILNGMRLRRG
jgi:Cd2+/Zn2+-exporting ATPase